MQLKIFFKRVTYRVLINMFVHEKCIHTNSHTNTMSLILYKLARF